MNDPCPARSEGCPCDVTLRMRSGAGASTTRPRLAAVTRAPCASSIRVVYVGLRSRGRMYRGPPPPPPQLPPELLSPSDVSAATAAAAAAALIPRAPTAGRGAAWRAGSGSSSKNRTAAESPVRITRPARTRTLTLAVLAGQQTAASGRCKLCTVLHSEIHSLRASKRLGFQETGVPRYCASKKGSLAGP